MDHLLRPLMHTSITLKDQLTQWGVTFQVFTHPPVFTCEESQRLCPPMPGIKNKNLFFRDDKGKRYFLVSMAQDKQKSIQEIAECIGEKRIGFASERRLKETLGVEPGSVGVLALLNDADCKTSVFIDQDLLNEEWFQSHPLINTETWSLKTTDLNKCFEKTGHQMESVRL